MTILLFRAVTVFCHNFCAVPFASAQNEINNPLRTRLDTNALLPHRHNILCGKFMRGVLVRLSSNILVVGQLYQLSSDLRVKA